MAEGSSWMRGFELFTDKRLKCVICGKFCTETFRTPKHGEFPRCTEDRCRREWERKFGQ